MYKYFIKIILILILLFLFGCHPALRKEAERPEQALIPEKHFYPRFHDDTDFGSLAEAIRKNIEYLNRLESDYLFQYGPHQYTSSQVIESQETFLKIILSTRDPNDINDRIKQRFMVYRAAGRVENKQVLFTGYFEPIYEGNLIPDETYSHPLYRQPDDLLKIDLSLFREEFKGKRIVGKVEGSRVVPYHTREEIEMEKALAGKNLEIAWLKDPVDVTFLHIQGSGRLRLPNGEKISVGYKASNGRRYRSIGRYLLDRGLMSREEMSMQGIRRFLVDHPEVMDEVLNHNPSYVFFRIAEGGPYGNINVQLTPGRSIALDANLFPKGALCFISAQKPVINNSGRITGWENFSRFVMNQDTGGAIKGAGRADLFWGSDDYAQLAAGHMKHEGDLYVLIKKFR